MGQNLYVSLQDDERILRFDIDEATGGLSEPVALSVPGGPAPLAIAPDGRRLYAGLRGKAGLAWLLRDPATGALSPGGAIGLEIDPCFLATDRSGRFLFSAYYRAGQVGVHPLLDDGSIGGAPIEWLRTAVNAHSMQTDPANRYAFVPHTGPNLILQFRFDAATGRLAPNDVPRAAPPAGVGPRHFCFHPNGRLVLFSNELASSVSSYSFDPAAGTLSLLDTVSTLPSGFTGANTCAQIHMTPDGRFVYVSNRGHDSIAAVAVDGASGRLRLLAATASEKVPRAFNLDVDGRWLYAAGQESGWLASYAVGGDGLLSPIGRVPLGRKPLWVLAAKYSSGPGRDRPGREASGVTAFEEPDPRSERMVERQIASRGIAGPRLLAAMRRVPRALFLPPGSTADSYADAPVSIGGGQTMSQPYMVALMLEALGLRGNETVLEIGTGSGYQTALLSLLARAVFTVERLAPLAERSRATFERLGLVNVATLCGDGSRGWPEHAPYQAIVVSAASPHVPPSLRAQLADNGVLVVPVGPDEAVQILNVVRRVGARFEVERGIPCRFVPLIGAEGFGPRESRSGGAGDGSSHEDEGSSPVEDRPCRSRDVEGRDGRVASGRDAGGRRRVTRGPAGSCRAGTVAPVDQSPPVLYSSPPWL